MNGRRWLVRGMALLLFTSCLFAPYGGEGDDDPPPREELQDDECDHAYNAPGDAITAPSASVALYYKGATAAIPDGHVIERILNGEKVELTASASFSSGIAGRNTNWVADGAEEVVEEAYTWSPQGGGGDSATFSPGEKGKKSIRVTYRKSVRQRFKVTVYCTKDGCGHSKEVSRTATASASASDAVDWHVYALVIKARRSGSGAEYATSATIAAGPYSSDVHRADIEFSLDPAGPANSALSFPLEINNAHGAQSSNHKAAVWYVDGDPIINNVDDAGNGSGSVSLSNTAYAKMSPSNFLRTARLSSPAGGSLSVQFGWGGLRDWEHDDYFLYDSLSPVSNESYLGSEPLDGHSLEFFIERVTGYEWDYEAGEWVDFDYRIDEVGSDFMQIFGRFYDDEHGNGDGVAITDGDGRAEAWLAVWSYGDSVTENVYVYAKDQGVWRQGKGNGS